MTGRGRGWPHWTAFDDQYRAATEATRRIWDRWHAVDGSETFPTLPVDIHDGTAVSARVQEWRDMDERIATCQHTLLHSPMALIGRLSLVGYVACDDCMDSLDDQWDVVFGGPHTLETGPCDACARPMLGEAYVLQLEAEPHLVLMAVVCRVCYREPMST